MKLEDKIAIMQHHADGGEVEYQNNRDDWIVADTPSWDWCSIAYRIPPKKPIKLWYWEYKIGKTWNMTNYRYATELEVQASASVKIDEICRLDVLGAKDE